VGEKRWCELTELMGEAEKAVGELVGEEVYMEYLQRKERIEATTDRELEGKMKERYVEKIREVDGLNERLREQFELRIQAKVMQMEESFKMQLEEVNRLHQLEKENTKQVTRRQYKNELRQIREENDKKIEEMKTDILKLEAENKDLLLSISTKEGLLNSKEAGKNIKPLISYDTFNALYKGIMGTAINISSSSSIYLDTSKQETKKLIKQMAQFRMPHFDYLRLDKVEEKDEVVRNFMLSLEVESLNRFYFNYDSSKVIKIDFYADALARVAQISQYKHFYIESSEVNIENLKLLMSAAKNSEYICFIS
jgi:hypothetical protein